MTDPVITVYSQLVKLLQAEPSLYSAAGPANGLIAPGNFIEFSGVAPYRQKTATQTGDFPQLTLDEGAFADTGFSKWPTFATFGPQPGPPQAWKEEFTQAYLVTLIMPDMRIAPGTALRNAIALALRKSGARLGLPALVKSWGPLTSSASSVASPQTGGTLRRVIKINIPVVFLFDGQTIVI